jgi:hypothetical protein
LFYTLSKPLKKDSRAVKRIDYERMDSVRWLRSRSQINEGSEPVLLFLGEEDVGQHILLALENLPEPSVVDNETRIVSVVVT